jgi:hypothetical protein
MTASGEAGKIVCHFLLYCRSSPCKRSLHLTNNLSSALYLPRAASAHAVFQIPSSGKDLVTEVTGPGRTPAADTAASKLTPILIFKAMVGGFSQHKGAASVSACIQSRSFEANAVPPSVTSPPRCLARFRNICRRILAISLIPDAAAAGSYLMLLLFRSGLHHDLVWRLVMA